MRLRYLDVLPHEISCGAFNHCHEVEHLQVHIWTYNCGERYRLRQFRLSGGELEQYRSGSRAEFHHRVYLPPGTGMNNDTWFTRHGIPLVPADNAGNKCTVKSVQKFFCEFSATNYQHVYIFQIDDSFRCARRILPMRFSEGARCALRCKNG